MGSVTTGPTIGPSVRRYQAGDEAAVLALVNADRITGQPETTPPMLAEALAGRSPVDSGWWDELDTPVTDVVHNATGVVLGVVSYAVRSSDSTGFILWLHGREDPAVVSALIDHALTSLGRRRTVSAFEFASALSLGLEGLPAGRRPATRRALEAAGFSGRNLWRHMHAELPLTGLRHATHLQVTDCEDPPGKRLEVREDGALLAEATRSRPASEGPSDEPLRRPGGASGPARPHPRSGTAPTRRPTASPAASPARSPDPPRPGAPAASRRAAGPRGSGCHRAYR